MFVLSTPILVSRCEMFVLNVLENISVCFDLFKTVDLHMKIS